MEIRIGRIEDAVLLSIVTVQYEGQAKCHVKNTSLPESLYVGDPHCKKTEWEHSCSVRLELPFIICEIDEVLFENSYYVVFLLFKVGTFSRHRLINRSACLASLFGLKDHQSQCGID